MFVKVFFSCGNSEGIIDKKAVTGGTDAGRSRGFSGVRCPATAEFFPVPGYPNYPRNIQEKSVEALPERAGKGAYDKTIDSVVHGCFHRSGFRGMLSSETGLQPDLPAKDSAWSAGKKDRIYRSRGK
jgi:hypothetical protein